MSRHACVRYLNAGAFFTKSHAENFVRRVSTLVADEHDVGADGTQRLHPKP